MHPGTFMLAEIQDFMLALVDAALQRPARNQLNKRQQVEVPLQRLLVALLLQIIGSGVIDA